MPTERAGLRAWPLPIADKEKMLDYYRRMGIEVTPEMTLAPEKTMGVQPTAK